MKILEKCQKVIFHVIFANFGTIRPTPQGLWGGGANQPFPVPEIVMIVLGPKNAQEGGKMMFL